MFLVRSKWYRFSVSWMDYYKIQEVAQLSKILSVDNYKLNAHNYYEQMTFRIYW